MSEYIVTTAQLAEILRVTVRRVNQLGSEGMPRAGRGQWDLSEVIQHLTADRETDSTKNMTKQRQALYAAQTEREELQNAQRRGELVEVEEVAHVLNELSVAFSSQIDAIGARLANDLVGVNEPAEIKDRIDDETRQVRESVASIVENWAAAQNVGEDSQAAA